MKVIKTISVIIAANYFISGDVVCCSKMTATKTVTAF